MRMILTLAGMLALAGCSTQPEVNEDELEDFSPPTVQVRTDVVQRQQRRFERLDKNKDGFIAPDEYPKRRPERVATLDGDKDGKVSRSELVEGSLKRFDSIDANKDGQITPEERRAVPDASPTAK